MPNLTVYLRPSDHKVWRKAREIAAIERVSISQLIVSALAEYFKKYSNK